MQPHEFTDQLNDQAIVAAIVTAEAKCSGEIRVFVGQRRVTNVMTAAWHQFKQLGMEQTRHRNGVLIYFAPRSRQFAVIGDLGVHQKCGDTFWRDVSTTMSQQLKLGKLTEAVVEAVGKIGNLLAQHFPPDSENPNELPNSIVRK